MANRERARMPRLVTRGSGHRPKLPDWLERHRGKYGKVWPSFFVGEPSVIRFWESLASRIEDFDSHTALRLFDAIEEGLRLSGSKVQTWSQRRRVGKKIARKASELAELVRPTDVPGYLPGFAINDPLQRAIHDPFQQLMDRFLDQMVEGGWISPKPEGREDLMLRAGARYAVWHLHGAIELLAKAGERWAETPPMQGQLKGPRALRRSVLFEVSKYMISFTGARRPALEAAAVNILFQEEGVEPLGSRRRDVDEAMSKIHLRKLFAAQAAKVQMERDRAEWLKNPLNAAYLERVMSGVKSKK